MAKTGCTIETGRIHPRWVIGLAMILGLVPLILYWFYCGRVPKVTPQQAADLLLATDRRAVLVDIRPAGDFASAHIDGSVNWPLEQILEFRPGDPLPEPFQNRILLMLCPGGLSGSSAAQHLIESGIIGVKYVRGGIQEWVGNFGHREGGIYERFRSESGKIRPFPYRPSPLHEQIVAVLNAFVIKPTYTLLALVVAILLWKCKSLDLAALRWSMVCFFVGENFCAANYIFFKDHSYLFEFLHGFGMLLSFGLAFFAGLEGFDSRILMLSDSDRKCAALRLCGKCVKYEDVPCGLKRVFFLIIPALATIAFIPMLAGWCRSSYNTQIFGTLFHYTRRYLYQHFEKQYCPIAAIVLLTASFAVLAFKKNNPLLWAKVFFAAGVGALGFGMFRSVLTMMNCQNLVWFAFWEEYTELLFILGICFVLRIFRKGLFETPIRDNEFHPLAH
jgi:rhodanese-related sulfurtransferase